MISDRERGKVINDMLPIYCQEEGVEGLHQSYINVHGLCRLPRVHAYGTTVDGNGNICTRCKNTRLDECPEDAPAGLQLRHCQKGQYMLVRIPPHCKVDWKDRKYFHERVRRYHAKDTRMERFKMVGFSRF
jgi:hypothetical protein